MIVLKYNFTKDHVSVLNYFRIDDICKIEMFDNYKQKEGFAWDGIIREGIRGYVSLGTLRAFVYCAWRSSLITLGSDLRLPSLSVRAERSDTIVGLAETS